MATNNAILLFGFKLTSMKLSSNFSLPLSALGAITIDQTSKHQTFWIRNPVAFCVTFRVICSSLDFNLKYFYFFLEFLPGSMTTNDAIHFLALSWLPQKLVQTFLSLSAPGAITNDQTSKHRPVQIRNPVAFNVAFIVTCSLDFNLKYFKKKSWILSWIHDNKRCKTFFWLYADFHETWFKLFFSFIRPWRDHKWPNVKTPNCFNLFFCHFDLWTKN